jgi:3alpha(or 20beta)-hydroxysteroid dehydrogenase
MGRLEGKVALISGSARGQGEAIARAFVAEGAKVVVSDILDDQGKAVADSLGADAAWIHLDVRKSADWKAGVDFTVRTFGKLNVLINNAGVFPAASMLEMSEEDYLEVIHVNQLGVWLGMRAAAGAIHQAGGGSIVNTASVAGMAGIPKMSAYVSSKHAVRGMSKTAAAEFGPLGIRVNSIYPGGVLSEGISAGIDPAVIKALFGHLAIPRPGGTAEIAKLMVFLASDESSYCTGSEILIDGGAQAAASNLPNGAD